MNRFNLTFKGEIHAGRNPEQTRLRVGELLGIDDPQELENCFSGKTVVLRGNLDRKVAAEYFYKLKKLGVEVELVNIAADQPSAATAEPPPPPETKKTTTDEPSRPPEEKNKPTASELGGQSWAVSTNLVSPQKQGKQSAGKPDTQELERKAAEEAAIIEAEIAVQKEREATRIAAEEARKLEAEIAAKKLASEKKAARQKALREQLEREAAEEQSKKEQAAARKKAQRERQKRQAEEKKRKKVAEAARLKALREEQQHEAAEKKRRKEEEAARQKALREEQERKAAEKKRRKEEEAARQKALREEQERKAAEEKRRKEEEAARQKALREEQERKVAEEKRQKEEEAALQKALREERKRKAAEEKRRKEEKAALRKAEQEQRRREEELRRRAEEAARQQALLEEEERQASEEAARRKSQEETARQAAALAERKRQEAEEEERRAAQQATALRAAEEAAKLEAELARQKRKQAEESERKAGEKAVQRKTAEEEAIRKAKLAQEEARKAERARIEAVRAEHEAQRIAMDEASVQRAAQELGRQPSLKPVEARVKTRIEVPRGKSIDATGDKKAIVNPRQPGVPNLYSLRPFRNTPEVRSRADFSAQRARRSFTVATLALAALLIASASYLGLPSLVEITGARGMTLAPQSGPALLAGDTLLLHDRAGVGKQSLTPKDFGVAELNGPMLANDREELLVMGRLATDDIQGAGTSSQQLLRCQLTEPRCEAFSPEITSANITAMVQHPLTGTLFLADSDTGELLQVSKDGEILGRANASIPEHPVMQLVSGLLFINSVNGPAISVLRYDEGALGQQLDEILLLPPPAIDAGQTRVWDFTRTGDQWWATLYNPETDSAGVYRFDEQWSFISAVPLDENFRPEQLGSWGTKTLIRDSHHVPLQRFNAQGEVEVALTSDLLESLVSGNRRGARLQQLAWRSGLVILALLVLAGFCLGKLHRTRSLVYRPHREHGAVPIDGLAETASWITPLPDRKNRIRRVEVAYGALALAALALAIVLGVSVLKMTALLLALSGPTIALVLFSRSPIGHLGILPGQLLLVDHTDMYHLGADARLQYRGPFLLVDDVIVFTGSRLFPVFPEQRIKQEVAPLARAGIKIDRKTVFIKLLEGRHPLARGLLATAVGLLLATALLALG